MQNFGTRKSVDRARRRKPGTFTTNFNAEVTSCRQTGICLNRLAVPCGFDSASHSIPQSTPPLLPTISNPQPSEVSPQNSKLPVLSPLPLPSELTPEENSLHFLPPLRTCCKLPLSSTPIWDTSSHPHRRSLHFLSNLCAKTYASRSQHIFYGRHLLFPQLRCFWWGLRVLQWQKFFLKA